MAEVGIGDMIQELFGRVRGPALLEALEKQRAGLVRLMRERAAMADAEARAADFREQGNKKMEMIVQSALAAHRRSWMVALDDHLAHDIDVIVIAIEGVAMTRDELAAGGLDHLAKLFDPNIKD